MQQVSAIRRLHPYPKTWRVAKVGDLLAALKIGQGAPVEASGRPDLHGKRSDILEGDARKRELLVRAAYVELVNVGEGEVLLDIPKYRT